MKKSFRLFIGSMILAATVAAAGISQKGPGSSGADPVPICPPDGCVISQ